MSEECTFQVEVRDFKATNLTSRNRFKDKLRLVCEFDDKKFKTKKELIGGGDVQWRFSWKSEYRIFSYKYLEERTLKITCMRSKTEVYGQLRVDLYTIATGPEEHNLPLLDFEGKPVGRLNFVVEMPQVSNIAVIFKQVKLKNLKPVGANRECNPYLKYTYSKLWPLVLDNRAKATYSSTQHGTTDPVWNDLAEVRFHASLKELLHESIVLHVTHHGKVTNTTLGRCNLLFRTLVDNGKTFKDEDLISFKGPLKVEDAEIEGVLIFKFLPKFAQMKPLNIVKKAIHTEKGVYDAVPLLPALPKPNVPIINSDATNLPEIPKVTVQQQSAPKSSLPDSGRKRAQTSWTDSRASQDWDDQDSRAYRANSMEDKYNEDIPDKPNDDNTSQQRGETQTIPKQKPSGATVEDLISFTPPSLRRQRSASTSFNPFATPTPTISPGIVSLHSQIGTPTTLQPVVNQPGGFPAAIYNSANQPLSSPFNSPPFNPGYNPSPFMSSPPQTPYNPFAPPVQQPQQSINPFASTDNNSPSFNPFAPGGTTMSSPSTQQKNNSPFNF